MVISFSHEELTVMLWSGQCIKKCIGHLVEQCYHQRESASDETILTDVETV